MSAIFRTKALLWVVLAVFPAVAVWKYNGTQAAPAKPQARSSGDSVQAAVKEPVVRVPVEVIATGTAPQWVYVEVGNQAVPEPGMISLFALTSLLLAFRRQRQE